MRQQHKKVEEHPFSVGNHKRKKSGLAYSQPVQDMEKLDTAVWVPFVCLDFPTYKMENRLGDEA